MMKKVTNSMYQQAYQNQIGSTKLNITKAVVGSFINCQLTYTVGFTGIDDSGSLKVLFRIVSDCGEPQVTSPKGENYLSITSSNAALKIKVSSQSTGLYGKVFERPWSRGFALHLANVSLKQGDKLYISLAKWRVQSFCEKQFIIKVLVDPFATGRYVEVPNSPAFAIIPGKPHYLEVMAPAKVKVEQPFKIGVVVKDRWGNPCVAEKGSVKIKPSKDFNSIPKQLKLHQGRGVMQTALNREGTTHLQVSYRNLTGCSNPIISCKNPFYLHFFADLHGQSEETVGTGSVDDYFRFARDYSSLNVVSHQGNDFQITNSFWKKLNQVTKKMNKDGEFIAFPGYEWSGNTPHGGDRNVVYLHENEPLYRSSHALLHDFRDLKTDAPTASHLFQKLSLPKAIVFAHVGGRCANLAIHSEKLEKAVEIHSVWGTFEWFFFEALKRGYKIGVVAGSDGHTGKPGGEYPTLSHFYNHGGLTCILAPHLTRQAIFQALRQRHFFATTGARIFLEVNCNQAGGRKPAMMGDEIKVQNVPTFSVVCHGTAPFDRVEVYNQTSVIYQHLPKVKELNSKTVKIVWSGAKGRMRKKDFNWQGKLELIGNEMEKEIERINFHDPAHLERVNSRTIAWQGLTTGNVQGIILKIEDRHRGEMKMEVNEKRYSIPLSSISQRPTSYPFAGLEAKLEIYEIPHRAPRDVEFSYSCHRLKKGLNPVFVKIIQRDGHMAWSSPIYFNYQK